MQKSADTKIPRVLIVDDDENIPIFLTHYADRYGYALEFVYARDVGEGLDRLNELCFDAAVVDVMLGGVTGVSMAQEIRKHDTLIPMAYLTNLDDEKVREQARRHNAQFLFKQHFQMSEDGPRQLIEIINHLATMNPCLPGGVRIDAEGFQRQLPSTPIRMAEPFMKLLNQNRIATAARAA